MKAYILLLSLCLVEFSLSKSVKAIEFSEFYNYYCSTTKDSYKFILRGKTENMENGEKITILFEKPGWVTAECTLTKSTASNSGEDVFDCVIDTKKFALIDEILEFSKDLTNIYQDKNHELEITGWEKILASNPIEQKANCYYPPDYQLNLLLEKGYTKTCLSGNQQELIFSGAYKDLKPKTSLKSTEKYQIKPTILVGGEKLDWTQADCIITPDASTESNSSETACTVKCTFTGTTSAYFFNTIVPWDSASTAEENSSEYVFIPNSPKIAICNSSFLKFSAFLLLSLLLL